MSESHETLTDKQTAIRIAAVIGSLVIVLLVTAIAAGLLS